MKTFHHSLNRASDIFLCGMVRGQAERFVSMPHKIISNASADGATEAISGGVFISAGRKPSAAESVKNGEENRYMAYAVALTHACQKPRTQFIETVERRLA